MARSAYVLALLTTGVLSACNQKPQEPASASPEKGSETATQADGKATADAKAALDAKAATAVTPAPSAGATVDPKAPAAPEDVAAPPKDAKKTPSGLASRVLSKGTGTEHPADADRVKVHYSGWTKDGKLFDSSVQRGEPATFGVGQVIPGWTEALKLMVPGEKRRLWIPAKLAYGESPQMGAPAGDLTFDVELLEILAAPKAPTDVKAPPKDAKKTESGLAYRVLKKGSGKAHPKPTDKVTVHYSGWTTDGTLFDSSEQRGQPATFALNGVIKGWTEGVALMVEGEKTRFWIPAALAYGEKPSRPGAPSGMLVFDIELLQIR